jgi:hypothetical protein
MQLTSLLYVSTSTLADNEADDAVRAMVARATQDNASCGLTGALLFTGRHFAQVLEGADAEVDRLMAKVHVDPRHENLIEIDRANLDARRFSSWGMAYMGPSQFVARHISRLLNAPIKSEKVRTARWLSELMFEFSKY